jgi:histidinol-phosphate aminotransferase
MAATTALAEPPLVVVDEAYFEFVGLTVLPWRERYPNLLVVRTLSKAFGLAGIRVGFGIGTRSVIARLERVRPPGSISTVSAHLGAAALRRPELARENVARLSAEREWLAARLAEAGWQPSPSVANFLLVRIGNHAAADEAAEGLLRAGIVPRTFGPANPLRGHLRLTIRSRAENERLLEALRGL